MTNRTAKTDKESLEKTIKCDGANCDASFTAIDAWQCVSISLRDDWHIVRDSNAEIVLCQKCFKLFKPIITNYAA